jgi:hypothetical protein
MIAGERTIQKFEAKTRKVAEVLKIGAHDPDPHGLCLRRQFVLLRRGAHGGQRGYGSIDKVLGIRDRF